MICVVWAACVCITGIFCSLFNVYGFDWSVVCPFGVMRPNVLLEMIKSLAFAYCYTFFWLFLTYILPGITMVCVYAIIFVTVKKQVRNIQPLVNGLGLTHSTVSSVKTAKKLCIICSAYFITNFLFFITNVPFTSFPPWTVFICHWLYLYSGAVNTFLYIVLNRSVQREIRRTFCFWRKLQDNDTTLSQGGFVHTNT